MNKLLVILLTCFASSPLWSQQDAMFTHYAFNTLAVNPGYAGSRDVLTITGLHRSQWVSFPGAPVTQTLTVHSPVINKQLGAGLSFISDRIGPSKNNGVFLDFSYKIKVQEKGKLSFGLKAGLNMRSDEIGGLSTIQNDDPSFEQNIQSQLLPNFGFGLYYTQPRFYAGLSIPRLLENQFDTNVIVGGTDLASESRHYYFIAGTLIDLKPDGSLKLKPTTFLKVTAGAPIEMDITALFYYQDFLWVGPMFRTGDAFGALAGVNMTDQFSLGYSFDWSFANTTGRYNGGSHELMLRYDFIFNEKAKIDSPRYF
ncbi:type IX secretion system membrane protein PorP/SprF [Crocinitomicaceae bacterium]|jgi:type IX secretion system PorP/SprF family membrane protein|nr:type IX secretion system membrane protein PorP/SprF [Crocinitomicaceae bacterium]